MNECLKIKIFVVCFSIAFFPITGYAQGDIATKTMIVNELHVEVHDLQNQIIEEYKKQNVIMQEINELLQERIDNQK